MYQHFGLAFVLGCLIAFTTAETRTQNNFNQIHPQTTPEHSNDFLQERQVIDSYGAPTAPLVQEAVQSAPSYDGAWYPEQAQPVPSYNAGFNYQQPNFKAPVACVPNNGLAGFGANFLTTAIQVVMGLFAFSLLISLITKFAGASFLSDIFDERSFNQDSVAMYTELALNGIEKAKSLYEDVMNKK